MDVSTLKYNTLQEVCMFRKDWVSQFPLTQRIFSRNIDFSVLFPDSMHMGTFIWLCIIDILGR